MLTIAEMSLFIVGLLVALFVIISVMMMLIVLIQRPQGGGLSEAFGSASGSGHTAFGAKTGDALTYATIFIFVAFIGFAVGLNYLVRPPSKSAEVPAVTPAPGAAPTETVPSAPAGTNQDSGKTAEPAAGEHRGSEPAAEPKPTPDAAATTPPTPPAPAEPAKPQTP